MDKIKHHEKPRYQYDDDDDDDIVLMRAGAFTKHNHKQVFDKQSMVMQVEAPTVPAGSCRLLPSSQTPTAGVGPASTQCLSSQVIGNEEEEVVYAGDFSA